MCRLRKWQEAQWAEQLFWSRFTEDYIHQTKELEARWIIGKDFRLRGEDLQEFIMVEIGCGPLGFLPFIKGRLKVGLDPIVHNLWKKVADVDYMRAIGEFLPIRSESVDVVICYNVIDHCMDPCRVLKEINRILRPRGLLLFEVNVYGRIFTYIKIFSEKLRGKLVTFDVRHPHTFHKKSVYSLLRVAGFDIIRGNLTILLKTRETIDELYRVRKKGILRYIMACALCLVSNGDPFQVQQFKALAKKKKRIDGGHHLKNVKDMPKVSVVVIEKNEARRIEKCLDSLLAQTYPNIEIVVVDGNSTDGTRELILSKYSRHENLKFIIEPGLGFAHARNIGVKNSTGDIIAFTGGDEFAHSKWIENLVGNFKSNEIGGVYGRMVVADDKGGLLKRFCKFKRDVEFSRVSPDKGFYGRGTNMAFRRSVIEEVGFFDENLCDADDTELAWRVSKRYKILYDSSAIVFHQSGEWESWRSFIKYLWKPIKGHVQAARKNGLLNYYPQTTLLYLAPIFYTSLLIFLFLIRELILLLFVLFPAIIGLFIKVTKDYVKFHDTAAFYGLLIYPLQLIIGSVALLTVLIRKDKETAKAL